MELVPLIIDGHVIAGPGATRIKCGAWEPSSRWHARRGRERDGSFPLSEQLRKLQRIDKSESPAAILNDRSPKVITISMARPYIYASVQNLNEIGSVL